MPNFARRSAEMNHRDHERVYNLAYLMLGSRDEARAQLRRYLDQPTGVLDGDALIGGFARHLIESLSRKARVSFTKLDRVLRSRPTEALDFNAPPIGGDLDRLEAMLWEMKRTCLTQVLACLSPGTRIAFILVDVLAFSSARASELLQVSESAFGMRLRRARHSVIDYLTPRCQHVDPAAACTCAGRLQIGIEAGLVRAPPAWEPRPARAHNADPPCRGVLGLYKRLPSVTLPAATLLERRD